MIDSSEKCNCESKAAFELQSLGVIMEANEIKAFLHPLIIDKEQTKKTMPMPQTHRLVMQSSELINYHNQQYHTRP